jgi:hypothetical protein
MNRADSRFGGREKRVGFTMREQQPCRPIEQSLNVENGTYHFAPLAHLRRLLFPTEIAIA